MTTQTQNPETYDAGYQFLQSNEENANANAIQFRLDTTSLLNDIYLFLHGKKLRLVRDETQGLVYTEETDASSERLMNEDGATALFLWFKAHFNHHISQGYISKDQHGRYASWLRKDCAHYVFVNMIKWEIAEEHYDYIVNTLVGTLTLYLTRLIEDKEREHLGIFGRMVRSIRKSSNQDQNPYV